MTTPTHHAPTRIARIKRRSIVSVRRCRVIAAVVLFVVCGLLGLRFLRLSSAATISSSAEAEAGQVDGNADGLQDSTASAAGAVRFGLSNDTPSLKQEGLLSGRDHIWDALQLPSGDILFDERFGKMSLLRGSQVVSVATLSDVSAMNKGGLMGMAVDPAFNSNHYVYACLDTANDVRVSRWQLANDKLNERKDIITGILRYTQESHSGCQLGFGADGYLWVGTGDAFTTGTAQSHTSLAGKVLRVTRDGEAPASGNMGGDFDPRIFNYGHRNIQGLAFLKTPRNGVYGFSVEHGPDTNDEVNELKNGNFGWGPTANPYEEDGVPMTDLKKYPNAISATWASGTDTQAPSGASMVYGAQWKGWNGSIAVGVLKGEHLKILHLDAALKVTKEEKILQGSYGRIRTATQGVDGNLYITTDNGGDDKIIRLSPK